MPEVAVVAGAALNSGALVVGADDTGAADGAGNEKAGLAVGACGGWLFSAGLSVVLGPKLKPPPNDGVGAAGLAPPNNPPLAACCGALEGVLLDSAGLPKLKDGVDEPLSAGLLPPRLANKPPPPALDVPVLAPNPGPGPAGGGPAGVVEGLPKEKAGFEALGAGVAAG